jgi:hypothetical protein
VEKQQKLKTTLEQIQEVKEKLLMETTKENNSKYYKERSRK